MSYKHYQVQLEKLMRNAKDRKAMKRIFGKKEITYKDYVENQVEGFLHEGSFIENKHEIELMSEELKWVNDGSPVIFLENNELAKSLHLASIDFKKQLIVEPPYKSFALSFPDKTVIDGIKLSSCLVSIMTRGEFVELSKSTLAFTEPTPEFAEENDLSISIRCSHTSEQSSGSFASFDKLDEFENAHSDDCAPEIQKELKILTKIALSLCVYHCATEGEKLVAGYPKSAVKMPKGKTRVDYKGLTLCSATQHKTAGGKQATRKIKYRIPFFRNLRAARFYKGKHKDKPMGSRWVWVKELDVGESMNTLLS
jgi:hypothetical protein